MQEMKCLTLKILGDPLTPCLICVPRAWGCWQGVPYFSTLKVATYVEAFNCIV